MEVTNNSENKFGGGSGSITVPVDQGEQSGNAHASDDDKVNMPPNLNVPPAKPTFRRVKRYRQITHGSSVCPSVPKLVRAREAYGRMCFVSREGAGVWSPDPLQQAIGKCPHFLRKMDLDAELIGHRGCVNTISATPDGMYWITGSDDLRLKVRYENKNPTLESMS